MRERCDLLDELELWNWYDTGTQLAREQARLRRQPELSNLPADAAVAAEDELLFVVGTLCLLNGQRALWAEIYRCFDECNGGDGSTQSAFAFLERMTREARRQSVESPRQAA